MRLRSCIRRIFMSDRIKYFKISPPSLVHLLKEGQHQIKVIKNALPRDAEVYSCGVDPFGYINLVIKSQEFEPVDEGDEIPVFDSPIFERIYPTDK